MHCPMCQHDLPASVPAPGADPYRACPACRGLFLASYPSRQTNTVFAGAAQAARQQALEVAREAYFLRHLVRIERRMAAGVHTWRLMEIGCGSGVLLRTARARGWRADGLELSAELAALAAAVCPTADVIYGDVADHADGAGDYDAVMALDVIEHVLDPEAMLRNCGAMLRGDGLLLLQTPNTRSLRHRLAGPRWDMRDPAQHINLFSARGLCGLLERTGFEVVTLQTVSGTGMERGWRHGVARIREWVLDRFKLGNALCVLARRRR